ncbi:hypothetical protein PIROE2DRAFT_60836 [Piromyces sp. E2]|nr:hypothetical protein PIROE2DRAFT_60836 [Piromyces sp. E2]|eukprot:OUM64156.1 hypothetical protein PIROE2DRAFT_60836 [Piromyces sp. E2]
MKYNTKIKRFLIGVMLLGRLKETVQLSVDNFKIITGNHSAAIECFRNPTRADCQKIEAYIKNLKDFRNGQIETAIYSEELPPSVEDIKLSNNIPLKEIIAPIPDEFIKNLTVCPFQSNDGVTVSNCSQKLKKLCGGKIKCVEDKTNDNDEKKDNKIDEAKDDNDEINMEELNESIKNSVDKTKINKNSNKPDVTDKEKNNKNDTKSLLETFMFGLLTSVGILVLLLMILCIIQTFSKKNIVNLKKLSEYYENKPLVNHSGKTSSSSMNSNSNNGTQSTHSNYAFSNCSQASYSNPKHKRYLYVFDDGSVMMSKSLHQNGRIIQNNASTSSNNQMTSVISNNNSSTNSNFNNNSLINVHNSVQTLHTRSSNNNPQQNSKLSISTTVASHNSNITFSPMIGSPIAESPIKTVNRNTVSIHIPPQIHENKFRQENRKTDIIYTTSSQ